MGRGFAEILTRELAPAAGIYAITPARLHSFGAVLGRRPENAPGISSERALAQAAGANRFAYGEYWLQREGLQARLTIEELPAGKIHVISASGADIVQTAAALARQLSTQAGVYGTRNSAAIRAYVLGLEDNDPAGAARHFQEAVAADPSFEPPYESLAQSRLQQRDRAGAAAVLQQAAVYRDRMPELERAQLAFSLASVKGDAAGRRQALAERARLTPNDPAVWASLGENAVARQDYPEAVQFYEKALSVQPEDPALLNQLGYANAYAGNLGGAVRALQQYRNLRPADANPLDSLGDVHLLLGRLREAEDYYLQAARRDPSALSGAEYRKAAIARLMSGDIAGAAKLDKEYVDRRVQARDPLADYYRAEWNWITGDRKQAYQQLAVFAHAAESGALRQVASEAYAELAVWSVALGDRSEAARMAREAGLLAGPASAATAAMAQFLAQPAAPAPEWQARADRAFPEPAAKPFKDRALVYALLAGRQFAAAAPILKQLHENTSAAGDDAIPVMLAWCDMETGQPKEAAALVRLNPLPPRSAIEPFRVFYFPRMFYLRGRVAQAAGQADAAREQFRLFLQLSGDTPLAWGEEAQARSQGSH